MGAFQLSMMVKIPTLANSNGTRIALALHENAKTGVLFLRHVNMSKHAFEPLLLVPSVPV